MTPSYIRILNDNKNDNKNVSACAFSEPPAAADSGAASEPPATSLSPASNPPASESPGIDREAALQRFCSDLEEWYAATLGVTRLPYDPQTIDGVAWLFENDFTLADIKAFYTWATTDPDQTRWRKGRVTIGAIVKGIADWRKDTRQSDTEKQAADDISLCPECRGDAMIPVFNGDEQVGVRRCRHVGLVAASQALW